MEKREIKDYIEMTTNAKNQTQEHVIRDLQLSIQSLKKIMENSEKRFDNLEGMIKDQNDMTRKQNALIERQNEDAIAHRAIVVAHMERVEPFVSAFERDSAFSRMLGEKGRKWGGAVIGIAAMIGAWYVIKEFIIKLIIK